MIPERVLFVLQISSSPVKSTSFLLHALWPSGHVHPSADPGKANAVPHIIDSISSYSAEAVREPPNAPYLRRSE